MSLVTSTIFIVPKTSASAVVYYYYVSLCPVSPPHAPRMQCLRCWFDRTRKSIRITHAAGTHTQAVHHSELSETPQKSRPPPSTENLQSHTGFEGLRVADTQPRSLVGICCNLRTTLLHNNAVAELGSTTMQPKLFSGRSIPGGGVAAPDLQQQQQSSSSIGRWYLLSHRAHL